MTFNFEILSVCYISKWDNERAHFKAHLLRLLQTNTYTTCSTIATSAYKIDPYTSMSFFAGSSKEDSFRNFLFASQSHKAYQTRPILHTN